MRVIIRSVGEFPGGPLVRIQHFHHRGMGSVPGLHQALCAVGKKKKKKSVSWAGFPRNGQETKIQVSVVYLAGDQ